MYVHIYTDIYYIYIFQKTVNKSYSSFEKENNSIGLDREIEIQAIIET